MYVCVCVCVQALMCACMHNYAASVNPNLQVRRESELPHDAQLHPSNINGTKSGSGSG